MWFNEELTSIVYRTVDWELGKE
jgi:hypothetical protein